MIKTLDYSGSGVGLLKIFKEQPHLFFLDSSQFNKGRGRYSFIGFSPFDVFEHKGKNSLDLLRKRAERFLFKEDGGSLPFKGGMVGFIGYDYGLRGENIVLKIKDELDMPDCFFGFYDAVLVIDHFGGKLYIISTGLPELNPKLRKMKAQEKIVKILNLIYLGSNCNGGKVNACSTLVAAGGMKGEIISNFSRPDYLEAVRKCLEHIGLGDVYQVNLSQMFCMDINCREYDPIDLYSQLRSISPSCFGAYLDCGDFNILSSSPERFLEVSGRKVQARPMKGTRPRGKNLIEDRKMKDEILRSRKDKAELLMITDLLRNDLGRVCDYGSVRVNEMRTLEAYDTVYQTTSTIEGILSKTKDVFDLLRECSPAGSITGCPKIRSMEIIEETERSRRGIYTGSLGYISFSGGMDFNILIRTLLTLPEKIYFSVGGGIVADSDPESEYKETLVKAKALFKSLNGLFDKKSSKRLEDKKALKIYLDGKIIRADEGSLENLTPGNLKGKGVFETMRARKHSVFAFDLHWKRLEKGLRYFKIYNHLGKEFVKKTIDELIEKNGFEDVRIRLCVWEKDKRIKTSIVCHKININKAEYKKGINAVISSVVREKTRCSHLKTIDYKVFQDAFKEAQNKKVQEAILLNSNGQVVEASRSNIFIVTKGVLFTPPLSSGCLAGITRKMVMTLAREGGIKCEERPLRAKDIFNAQEAFLTNSVSGIKPLVLVDGKYIGEGVPGLFSQELNVRYNSYLGIYC